MFSRRAHRNSQGLGARPRIGKRDAVVGATRLERRLHQETLPIARLSSSSSLSPLRKELDGGRESKLAIAPASQSLPDSHRGGSQRPSGSHQGYEDERNRARSRLGAAPFFHSFFAHPPPLSLSFSAGPFDSSSSSSLSLSPALKLFINMEGAGEGGGAGAATAAPAAAAAAAAPGANDASFFPGRREGGDSGKKLGDLDDGSLFSFFTSSGKKTSSTTKKIP